MSDNSANISRNSFDFKKYYDNVILQQGVPVVDSDWNEMNQVQSMMQIMQNFAVIGDSVIPPYPGYGDEGFNCEVIASTTDNFNIGAGWACVKGAIVPSTILAEIPTAHLYEDDTNYMVSGKVTGVSGSEMSDTNKKFETYLDLVGCRMKMLSGAESGNTFTITAVPNQTTLDFSSVGSIGVDDIYIIKPPAIPASVASSETHEIHLWVWWEEINENEDTNIYNPGVGVETCRRLQRRWVVRYYESGAPVFSSGLDTFSWRQIKLADVSREPGESVITSITMDPDLANTTNLTKYKMFAEPQIVKVTGLSAATYFDLPLDLDYYFGTGSTASSVYPYFRMIYPADNARSPLLGSDGGAIGISKVNYDSSEVTDPATLTSGDGYLPGTKTTRIELDFTFTDDSNYTGDIWVKCYAAKTLEHFSATPPLAFPEASVMPQVAQNDVYTRAISSSDTDYNTSESLVQGNLSTALIGLLAMMAKRPPVYTGTPSNDNWYESKQLGNGSSLGNFSTLYWNRLGERIWVQGGVLENADRTIEANNASFISVEGWFVISGDLTYVRAIKKSPTSGNEYNPAVQGNWDTYFVEDDAGRSDFSPGNTHKGTETFEGPAIFDLINLGGLTVLTSTFDGFRDMRDIDAGGGRVLLYEAYSAGQGSIRLYLATDILAQDLLQFEVAINCAWIPSTSKWKFNDSSGATSTTSALYRFESSNGMSMLSRSSITDGSADWTDAQWSVSVNYSFLNAAGWQPPHVFGNATVRCKVCLRATNFHTSSYAVTAGQGVTWGAKLANVSGGAVSFIEEQNAGWGTGVLFIENIDSYGCTFHGTSDGASQFASPILAGYIYADIN